MNVCIIGRGKLGTALHRGLREAAVAAQLVSARALPRRLPAAEIYILAVSDPQIRRLCGALAHRFAPRSVVLHCAGSLGSAELESARARGLSVGVMHPLVSFPEPKRAALLQGASFVLSGDARARTAMRRLTRALGARALTRPEPGPAYHAAAALVANGAAALTYLGTRILVELGLPARQAEQALAHLLHSVAQNIEQVGLPRALTGPVARGDAATLERHLEALGALHPTLAQAYASVQPMVLACAREAGLPSARAQRIERVLSRTGVSRARSRARRATE